MIIDGDLTCSAKPFSRLATALVGATLFTALPARAATYSFTWVGSVTGIVNGTAVTDSNDVLTSLTGSVSDDVYSGAISSVVAPGTPGYSNWAWDNVLTATPPNFSATQSSGILFLFDNDTVIGNLYYQPNNSTFYFSVSAPDSLYNPGDAGVLTIADISGIGGETPLPAALPLFATGLGALGALGWRRKRKAAA